MLRIDVDGPKALDVVSGEVRSIGERTPINRFVGRVTTRRRSDSLVAIDVADLSVEWHCSSAPPTALKIRINRTVTQERQLFATIQFLGSDELIGLFYLARESPWFRTVEVQIDREEGAIDAEPYPSHEHPDRPGRLSDRLLTLEQVFADAGIHLTRSAVSNIISSEDAGKDREWSHQELHDAMTMNWEEFANHPQWKLWVLLAKQSEKALGGVMFDARINEPGGVDRQGVALFTRFEYFFSATGDYPINNPPAEQAARRELFYTLVHEMGHAFNLRHPTERNTGIVWAAPTWTRMRRRRNALTFMNYPNIADPNGIGGANATWFYRRFNFCFERPELLFLRHAPEHYVEMGGAEWGTSDSRLRSHIDRRLGLVVRSRKTVYELGERIILELKLKNVSDVPVAVHECLNPNEGLVIVAVTGPDRRRIFHRPIQQSRPDTVAQQLAPEAAIYKRVDLTLGLDGFSFTTPGKYRIEVCYVNLDGSTARGYYILHVAPPSSDDARTVHELFDARVGRVLFVGGTRLLDDVNDKFDWVRARLGPRHPVSAHLAAIRFWPLARDGRVFDPTTRSFRLVPGEPDRAVALVEDLIEKLSPQTADTLGHIGYQRLVNRYSVAAAEAGRRNLAISALRRMVAMFEQRGVVPGVIEDAKVRIEEFGA